MKAKSNNKPKNKWALTMYSKTTTDKQYKAEQKKKIMDEIASRVYGRTIYSDSIYEWVLPTRR